MLDKIQKLLMFKVVSLTPNEVRFVMELNMGRILDSCNDGNYFLAYKKNPLENHTVDELIEDSAFLLHYYRASEEAQKFVAWIFEAKSFYLDKLYFKGFTNFYALLLKKIVS